MKNLAYTIDETVAQQRHQFLLKEADNHRMIKIALAHKTSRPWWDRLKNTLTLFLG